MKVFLCLAAMGVAAQACAATVFGRQESLFTVNGRPTFLLGISYYGGLGTSEEILRKDLDAFRQHGFNWIRVWATWSFRGTDVSAVDAAGRPRDPYMSRLVHLVRQCDRRGLIVDVTLTRGRFPTGGGIGDMAAHETAVRSIVAALKGFRNYYVDLANERDVRDARYVSVEELRTLRELARRSNPNLLVTASFGGHDLGDEYVREALFRADLDFVTPHRPRHRQSPSETERHTRECLAAMKRIGRVAPVHYQEPFRRGYTDWSPTAADFLTDLQGAIRGGAAGWCLHNGATRGAPDERPWRSFDLRERALMDQLDTEETQVLRQAAGVVREEWKPTVRRQRRPSPWPNRRVRCPLRSRQGLLRQIERCGALCRTPRPQADRPAGPGGFPTRSLLAERCALAGSPRAGGTLL